VATNTTTTSTKIRLNFSSAINPLPPIIPGSVPAGDDVDEDDEDLGEEDDYGDEDSMEEDEMIVVDDQPVAVDMHIKLPNGHTV
jgi:hypothetical protein